MGCAAATAKRRRKQAVGGYKQLPPQRRPHYTQHTTATYEKREARMRERRLIMATRGRRKKS